MTLTRSVLDRWLHRGACAIAAVFLVTALVQQWLDPLDYPPTVFWTWVALGVCVWVWALADALRNREIPWGLRAVVVVAIGAGLTHVIGGWGLSAIGSTPPLIQAMAPAFAVAGFAFSPRSSVVVGLLCGTIYALAEWPVAPPLIAVGSGAIMLGSSLVAGGAIDLLFRATRKVEHALADRWSAHEAVERSSARAEHMEFWDGLVHDKVLGALRLAARSRTDTDRLAAAELAREALATDGTSVRARLVDAATVRSRVEVLCDRLGLRLRWVVREAGSGVPEDLAAAAVASAEEALVNVARHSGQRDVEVRGLWGTDLALDIIDRGVGFEPSAVCPGRMGVDRGVVARMARAGGTGEVLSTPGHGTTVTLRGPHTDGTDDTHAAETPDTVETWRHRDFLGLFVVGAVLMVVYGLLALATAENARSTFVVVLCFVAALAIGLTAAFAPAHWTRLPWIIAPACGGVCWMGIVNLRDPYDAGWACWFVGALNATVVLLVGRFRLSAAVIAVVAAGTGVCLGQLHQGVAVNGGMVASLLPQMAAFALASWGVRKAIDMATEAMNASAAEVGRLRLADARAEEAARVAQSRSQDVIVQAGHLLERIAVAEPLSDPDRDRCRLAEAEARDALVANPLLTPDLRASVRQARERGVTVALAADESTVELGVPQFRGIVLVVVEAAPSGSRVNARLRRDERGRVGSITLVDALPDAQTLPRLLARIRELAGSLDLLMSVDDDLLVELWGGRAPA